MVDLLLWLAAWMGFSVLIAALPALVESLAFSRLSSGVRRGAWFVLALRAAVPVGLVPLVLPSLPGVVPPNPAPSGVALSPGPRAFSESVSALPSGVEWGWLLLAAYALGLAVVWVVQRSGRRAWNRAFETRRAPSPRLERIVGDLRGQLGLARGPQVAVVPSVPSPCLVGLFRPRLVLPEESRFTDAELAWMVRHELEHFRAGDLWLTAVVRVLHLVLWFLPGLWWISQRFSEALEESCDHRVLASTDAAGRHAYALTLMKFLQPTSPSTAIAMASPLRRLKHRFRLIRHPSQRSIPALVLLAVVVAASGAWGTAGAAVSPNPGWPFAPGTPCWVTSGFGEIENPITKKPYLHQGIDIAARINTPVRTIWAGTVTQAGFDADRGYFLTIDLGDGWSTLASHLAGLPSVVAGDRVGAGQEVARVGSTGLSTGPHLHLEVLKEGVAVNPAPYLVAP